MRTDPRADPVRRGGWAAAFRQAVEADPTHRTAVQIVRACGWGDSQARRYLGGQIPHPTHIRRIAAETGVDPAALLRAAGYELAAEIIDAPSNGAIARLHRAFDRVPAPKRDVFIQSVEHLADLAA